MGADDRTARLLDSGLALSAELSTDALLQRIVELAAELTGARYGALGVIGADGSLVDFLTTGVTAEERAAIGPLPRGRGILGALISDARPLRLDVIQDDPRSVGFPTNHPPMRSFLGAPVRAHGRVFGNLYLTEKQGAPAFTADDEAVLIVLATQAGVAIANARLFEESKQREQRLEAARQITAAILQGASSDQILRLVAHRARGVVSADTASIVTEDAVTGDLVISVAEGAHAGELEGMAIPREGSVSGEVIRGGRPALLADASTDTRTHQPMVASGQMGPSIFVPLTTRGVAFGTLAVARTVGAAGFVAEDVDTVQAFADQASLGLEYARTQQELGRLALIEDRERIAKDLHDGVIQALFAVGLGLQGAASLADDPRLGARLEEAVGEIDRVIGDLRSYIFGLRPQILAERRGTDALEQLAHEFQERTGVVTVADLDRSLDEALADRATHIVQLAREALSNVGRHAQATTCRLSLRRGDAGATLEIDDDGIGFDPEAGRRAGMGLTNLRERVASLEGVLQIHSVSGEGTTVRIDLPL